MRIPSQFNDESLYRRGSRRPNTADSTRRIFRLVVALILVFVVMQQASKPRVYEIFFSEDDDTEFSDAEGSLVPGTASKTSTPLISQSSKVQALPVSDQTKRLAQQLTSKMPAYEQRQWIVVLARWDQGKSFPLVRSVVAQAVAAVESFESIDQSERSAWVEAVTRFGNLYAESELVVGQQAATGVEDNPADVTPDTATEPLTDQDCVRLVSWLSALDAAAMDRVYDGSVWRSDDFDAFYRQLDQAESISGKGAAAVAVVPLLQQPQIYRGSLVKVSGTVALAESKEASANPYSIENYWQLWIKPDAGSDRPIVTIVRKIPESMADFTKAGGQPKVRLVGRYFKRLAYQSQMGADLAPVVIGRLVLPKQPVAAAAPVESTSSQWNKFLGTVAIALLFGVALAVVAMRRTSQSAQASREIRAQRHAPDLSELEATDFKNSDEGEES